MVKKIFLAAVILTLAACGGTGVIEMRAKGKNARGMGALATTLHEMHQSIRCPYGVHSAKRQVSAETRQGNFNKYYRPEPETKARVRGEFSC